MYSRYLQTGNYIPEPGQNTREAASQELPRRPVTCSPPPPVQTRSPMSGLPFLSKLDSSDLLILLILLLLMKEEDNSTILTAIALYFFM